MPAGAPHCRFVQQLSGRLFVELPIQLSLTKEVELWRLSAAALNSSAEF